MTTSEGNLLGFAADLARATSTDDLAERLYAGIDRVFVDAYVGFDVLDPSTFRPVSTTASGVSTFFLSRYDQFAREDDPVLNEAISHARVAYNLSSMSLREWTSHDIYREVFSLHHIVALVYAPVVVDGRVVATLNLGRNEQHPQFTPAEIDDASALASLISGVITTLRRTGVLERQVALYRETLDLVDEPIVISDITGAQRYQNTAAERVLERRAVDGQSFDEAIVALQTHDGTSAAPHWVRRSAPLVEDGAFVAFLEEQSVGHKIPEWLLRDLTPREADVFALVVTGLRDLEVAGRLNLSVHTVKGYLREVFRKSGARSRSELVHLAVSAERLRD